MAVLNSVYESTNIGPKKPFTISNLGDVVEYYNRRYGENITMSVFDGFVELSNLKDQFCFINMVESSLFKTKGYKLNDGKFIMPL